MLSSRTFLTVVQLNVPYGGPASIQGLPFGGVTFLHRFL